jgi:hypothetical protein
MWKVSSQSLVEILSSPTLLAQCWREGIGRGIEEGIRDFILCISTTATMKAYGRLGTKWALLPEAHVYLDIKVIVVKRRVSTERKSAGKAVIAEGYTESLAPTMMHRGIRTDRRRTCIDQLAVQECELA